MRFRVSAVESTQTALVILREAWNKFRQVVVPRDCLRLSGRTVTSRIMTRAESSVLIDFAFYFIRMRI